MRDPDEYLEYLVALIALVCLAFLIYVLFAGTPEEQQAVIKLLEAMD